MNHLSWLEAAIIGLLQGVTELFPVSSLGHSVLLPAWVGGHWHRDMDVSAPESTYLAFIVATHVATAIALLLYFRRDWVRLIRGFFTSIAHRRMQTPDEKLIWRLIVGTIPVGLVGLLFEHWLRTNLGRPLPTAAFLAVNGLIILLVDAIVRRRGDVEPDYVDERVSGPESDARLANLTWGQTLLIGSSQILALAPGISRSGAALCAGLLKGLKKEDAARFSFLLATPVILAAGVLKLPDLFSPLGDGIRWQALLGAVLAGIGAYVAVAFFTRYVSKRSLRPFGFYCLVAGLGSLVWFLAR
ncbi:MULTISPECIES: undecaprenyl-diphosphate phosphatase [Aestuariimicrobium]|uniref:undecaprenyl-diphosphate phosphatase n=1 Tax=Aestuariimicrobium TaxID=396388 RepID=UPI0003B505CC|nr:MULTISPECIES: undecaprenyl-diphosphate phosphatase [Aestuariimicrobium]CAI9403500.1 Undecaprenyl-diphosphatase [Aestuariimicrobium sp. T2.26MG-19.2B]